MWKPGGARSSLGSPGAFARPGASVRSVAGGRLDADGPGCPAAEGLIWSGAERSGGGVVAARLRDPEREKRRRLGVATSAAPALLLSAGLPVADSSLPAAACRRFGCPAPRSADDRPAVDCPVE